MISIITATYNSEKILKATLESLLNQSCSNFEYIIVDGASKDNTIEIIQTYQEKFQEKDILFKWISEKDTGIYDAWNKGISIANGDWIGFLGSDDQYCKDALENYSNIINNSTNLDYISSIVNVIDKNRVIKIISGQWNWKTFKKYMNVAHVGSLHSKTYFEKHGLFNVKYKIAGDYEILLRAKGKLNYKFLDVLTVEMGAGGVSNDLIYQTLNEAKEAKTLTGGMNKVQATIYFYWALIKFYLKSIIK